MRISAALALGLWYMLMPPIAKDGSIDAAAPLAQWQRVLAYSVEGSCADELETEIALAEKDPRIPARTRERLKSSVCVSEDDPRLRKPAH